MKKILLILFFSFLILPNVVFANIGIPLIFGTFPWMVWALVPVVVLEAEIGLRILKLGYKKAYLAFGLANIATTIIGVPLSWILLLLWEFFCAHILQTGAGVALYGGRYSYPFLNPAWLAPGDGIFFQYYVIPVALVINIVAAFFISVWIEGFILRKMLKDSDKKAVNKSVWIVNIVSYSLLIIISLVLFAVPWN